MKLRNLLTLSLIAFLSLTIVNAQEDDPILPYKVAPQNLLKFNRFLINPTFSTVREDKSYINLLHRNQSVQFQDNDQTYFLSYSGRIGDKSGLGLSLYTQKIGPISNIGVLANYAYGIKLSDKSNFTFGGNLAYYSTGLNRNDIDVVDINDFRLNGTEDSNVLSFQPGFNLSYGQFDFGVFAENLFDYNLKSSKMLTEFKDKTYSAHLQYTHPFQNGSGVFESARIMPLARVRMNPQNATTTDEQELSYGGSLILDLPKLGWLQGGYDTFYGASAGAGFNLNKRLSLGYTMEKGFGTDFNNLGVTHEISFAYSFTPNLTEDRVMLEDNNEELVNNEEFTQNDIASNEEVEELKRKLAENDAILAELMFRQDSLEAGRQKDLERRFEMVMRMVRNETNGTRPDIEKEAEKLFMGKGDNTAVASQNSDKNEIQPNGINPVVSNQKTDQAKNTVQEVLKSKNPIIQKTQPQDAIVSNDANKEAKISSKNTRQNHEDSKGDILKRTEQSRDAVASQNTSRKQPVSAQDNTNPQTTVKSRKFSNLEGVQDGYYVVANVYKGGLYMNKFIDKLNQQGLNADYVDNPNTGLKYVYLERYNTWQEAVDAHSSGVDGTYDGAMWIMNVDNRYSNDAYAENVSKIKEKSAKYDIDALQKNIVVKDELAATESNAKNFKINGVGSGYYIIANVFANPNNAKRFVKLLNSYGLSASYFVNPENNWRYVYLKRHQSWNNALISYYTKLNDAYDDKMWIMRVTPNQMT